MGRFATETIVASVLLSISFGCDGQSKQNKKQNAVDPVDVTGESPAAKPVGSLDFDQHAAMALAELDGLLNKLPNENENGYVLPDKIQNVDVFNRLFAAATEAFKKMDPASLDGRLEQAIKLLDADKDGKLTADEITAGSKALATRFQEFAPKYSERWSKYSKYQDVHCFVVNARVKDAKTGSIYAAVYGDSIGKCGFPDLFAPSGSFDEAFFCYRVLEMNAAQRLLPARHSDILFPMGPLPDETCDENIRPVPAIDAGSYAKNVCAPQRINLALRYRGVEMCKAKKEADKAKGASGIPEPNLNILAYEINKMVEGSSCDSVADCSQVGYGAKSCGGPRIYLAYSVKNIDEKELTAKVNQFNELDKNRNQKDGLISTCSVVEPRQLRCELALNSSHKTCQ